jgi:hypothetical protein
MKSFNARPSGYMRGSKINAFQWLASVASTLYKIINIYSKYRNVFSFYLASLVYRKFLSD